MVTGVAATETGTGVGEFDAPQDTVLGSEMVLLDLHRENLLPFLSGYSPAPATRMLIHTCPSVGVAALKNIAGNRVVAAATPLVIADTDRPDNFDGCFWAITAQGLWDRAVTEVFIEDLGGRLVEVPETLRPAFGAALAQATGHTAAVVADTVDQLSEALGEREFAVAALRELLPQTVRLGLEPKRRRPRDGGTAGAAGYTGGITDADEAAVLHAGITDPAAAAAFTSLVRRTAQRGGAVDVELWSHTNRG